MTAQQLIASIFAREQEDAAANLRRITQAQFDYLLLLVRREAEQEIGNGPGGAVVWTPAADVQYVLTAPPAGRRTGTLVKVSSQTSAGMGSLF